MLFKVRKHFWAKIVTGNAGISPVGSDFRDKSPSAKIGATYPGPVVQDPEEKGTCCVGRQSWFNSTGFASLHKYCCPSKEDWG